MPGSVRFGHQDADVATDDLLGAVAEQPFGGRAEAADLAVSLDGDDRVGCGVDHRTQQRGVEPATELVAEVSRRSERPRPNRLPCRSACSAARGRSIAAVPASQQSLELRCAALPDTCVSVAIRGTRHPGTRQEVRLAGVRLPDSPARTTLRGLAIRKAVNLEDQRRRNDLRRSNPTRRRFRSLGSGIGHRFPLLNNPHEKIHPSAGGGHSRSGNPDCEKPARARCK